MKFRPCTVERIRSPDSFGAGLQIANSASRCTVASITESRSSATNNSDSFDSWVSTTALASLHVARSNVQVATRQTAVIQPWRATYICGDGHQQPNNLGPPSK